MKRGFLLGKFLPPHNGHVALCDFGRSYCDHLTILVCSLPGDAIPGALRARWMRELFPDCRVVHFDNVVPQEPSQHPDFWEIWRRIVREAHPEPIDFVFASESYGSRLADELDADFVPVDPHRLAVPAAGHRVLADPATHWEYMPAPVRSFFVKKICLFGPESTGKSILAAKLAARFRTVFVPEYGRVYTEQFGLSCSRDDLHRIVMGHRAMTNAMLRQANRLLFLDTDAVLTVVWSKMLFNEVESTLHSVSDCSDFYLLTDVDVPWVDDGTRYFPAPDARSRFFRICQSELESRNLPYYVLSGDWNRRLEAAVTCINEKFGRFVALAEPPTLPA